ncbi:MAG: sensor histidine kinase [Syntrophomonadaceae bacterium]|jgi:signal transduction histidine kinase
MNNDRFCKYDGLQIQLAERKKIAQDLHDGPAQTIASAIIMLDLIAAQESQVSINQISEIKNMLKSALAEIRDIILDVQPAVAQKGLVPFLREYFKEYKLKFGFHIDFICCHLKDKYPNDIEIALFRVIQEAINNARKYARVKEARVQIQDEGRYLSLSINDSGIGFNKTNYNRLGAGQGLSGMKERVQLIGGEITISSQVGIGTHILIKVPLEERKCSGQDKGINCR